ncbi:Cof-type HAD-IIB family hydrolase [Oscillospiraceae bacterium PP1C4]
MKVVFFDIDGTLIDIDQRLTDSTAEAVRRLQHKGNLAILNTGRPICTIPKNVMALGFDGIVAACGTSVRLAGETLLEATIPQDLLSELLLLFERYNIKMILEAPDYLYVQDISDPDFAEEIENFKACGMDVFRSWNSPDVIANKLTYCTKMVGDISAVTDKLTEDFVRIIYDEYMEDWLLKGHTKATGAQLVLDRLGCTAKDSFTFGDSENDIELFEYVGCAVAMGNSSASVKQKSNYVTADVNDDGILKGLLHFGLL